MNLLHKLKGLLFDKDGTLIDFNQSWLPPLKAAAELVANQANQPALAKELLIHGGYLPESDSWSTDSIMAFETTGAMLESWAALTSTTLIEPLIPKIQAIVTESLSRAVPISQNTVAIFTALGRHYALGVASMDDEVNVKQTLDGLALNDLVDFYCGADSGFGHKPQAGMVQAFCLHTNLAPEHVAVIGDSQHDMKMAKAAGATAIAVESGASRMQDLSQYADMVFADIDAFYAQLS